MKNEQGITLIAIIIYVLLMTFVVAGVSAITQSFYTNVHELDKGSESAASYAKFNMYLINDIKSEKAEIYSVGDNHDEFQLRVKNGEIVKYSVQNGILYRNKVRICDKVRDVHISRGGPNTLNVTLLIDQYEKKTTYAVEPKMV